MTNKFCVYLTIYKGNKMPMFYIGSSSVIRVNKGYHGSVSSKEYKRIWDSEIKNNPCLFKTIIISMCDTKNDAILKERFFQTQLKVNKSIMYINKNIASPNGIDGVIRYGKDNGMYGKTRDDLIQFNHTRKGKHTHSDYTKKLISLKTSGENNPMYGKNHTTKTKQKLSSIVSGRIYEKTNCKFCNELYSVNNISNHESSCIMNPNRYTKFKHKKPRSEKCRMETSKRMLSMPSIECPHCHKLSNMGNAKRWHFDNCKFKPSS